MMARAWGVGEQNNMEMAPFETAPMLITFVMLGHWLQVSIFDIHAHPHFRFAPLSKL
jgi:hypothetical protein